MLFLRFQPINFTLGLNSNKDLSNWYMNYLQTIGVDFLFPTLTDCNIRAITYTKFSLFTVKRALEENNGIANNVTFEEVLQFCNIRPLVFHLFKWPRWLNDLSNSNTVSLVCQHSVCEFETCTWQVC